MWRMIILLPLTMCAADETLSGYADRKAVYHLQSMNGADFSGTATISFPQKGQVYGQGPCNTYSAQQSAPYPWFDIGSVQSTEIACPELDLENEYFTTLSEMSLAEVSGRVLILSNEKGAEMVFQSAE